jgi:hypothetical protein
MSGIENRSRRREGARAFLALAARFWALVGGLSLRAIRDRLAAEGVRVSHVAVGTALKADA